MEIQGYVEPIQAYEERKVRQYVHVRIVILLGGLARAKHIICTVLGFYFHDEITKRQ